jgi:hypothetical protein
MPDCPRISAAMPVNPLIEKGCEHRRTSLRTAAPTGEAIWKAANTHLSGSENVVRSSGVPAGAWGDAKSSNDEVWTRFMGPDVSNSQQEKQQ